MMTRSRILSWVVVGTCLVCFACGGASNGNGGGSAGAAAGGTGAAEAGAGGSPLGNSGGRAGNPGQSEHGGAGAGGTSTAGANGKGGAGASSTGGAASGGSSGAAGGSLGSSGSASGGSSGAAGAAAGASGAGAAGAGGNSGGLQFLACLTTTAIDRIRVQRIDATAGHCTTLVLQDTPTCHLGLSSGSWCLAEASVSTDMAACLAHELPAVSVAATAVSGTFSVATAGASLSTDLQLTFPASASLPTSVNMQVAACKPNCNSATDCRN